MAGKARLAGGFPGTTRRPRPGAAEATRHERAPPRLRPRPRHRVRQGRARSPTAAGNTYLDFAAGIGVNGLGYGDPKVVAAIRKQAGRLIHASNLYHTEPVSDAGRPPGRARLPVQGVLLQLGHGGGGGGDQVRAAHRPRAGAHGAGRLRGLLPRPHDGRPLAHLEREVPRALRAAGARRALLPWNDLKAAAAAHRAADGGGVRRARAGRGRRARGAPRLPAGPAPTSAARRARSSSPRRCSAGSGARASCSRYQHAGIRPDILTLAKPLGGGLPLGAVLLREELAGAHRAWATTAARSAATRWPRRRRWSCSTASPSDGFLAKVEKKGATAAPGPARAGSASTRPDRARCAASASWSGIEFSGPAAPSCKALRERGILATKAGDNVLRLLPPLVVKRKEIRSSCYALDAVLATGAGRCRPRKEAAVRLREAAEATSRRSSPSSTATPSAACCCAAPRSRCARALRGLHRGHDAVATASRDRRLRRADRCSGPALGEVRSLAVREPTTPASGLGRAHRGAPAGRGRASAASHEVLALTRRTSFFDALGLRGHAPRALPRQADGGLPGLPAEPLLRRDRHGPAARPPPRRVRRRRPGTRARIGRSV